MKPSFSHMALEAIATRGFLCDCGQRHGTGLRAIRIGSGVTGQLLDVLAGQKTAAGEPLEKGKHTILLVEDMNTPRCRRRKGGDAVRGRRCAGEPAAAGPGQGPLP